MNPLFAAVVRSLHPNQRECPRCGAKQAIPKEKSKESVVCRSCGATIPPPR